MHLRFLSALAVIVALLASPAAHAQGMAEPYDLAGRSIRLLVPSAAGGIVDTEARLVGAHLGRFLPGQPDIVVQNVPGAGGERMLEYINQNDATGSLTIAMISASTLLRARAGQLSVAFDPQTARWLGSIPSGLQAFVVSTATGITSPDMLVGRPLTAAAVSAGGTTHISYLLANRVLGYAIEPVVGYEAMGPMTLALARGEVDAILSPRSAFAQFLQPLIDAGEARLLFYMSLDDYPELGVPNALNMPMGEAEAQLLRVGLTGTSFGRPYLATPGADPAFVAALRTAFDRMAADAAFLADALALDIEVRYRDAAEIEAGVAGLYATPDDVIAEVAAVLFTE